MHDLHYPKPYGERGPKLKRPSIPDGDVDAALVAQIATLVIANASLAKPRSSLTWWSDKDADDLAEVECALRAVVAANPKVLRIDDSRKSATPALYLIRQADFDNVATIYYVKPESTP